MKPEEAIEIISNYRPGCGEKITYAEGEVCEAYDVAIEAIKEVQLYRLIKDATIREIAEALKEFSEIGTVEECREAVKKAKEMKVSDIHVDEYYCPNCGSENLCDQGVIGDKYCPNCGQKLEEE